MNLLITQNSQNLSHSHTTNTLRNKDGTATLTNTSGMSANSSGWFANQGLKRVDAGESARGGFVTASSSSLPNTNFGPAEGGSYKNRYDMNISHTHNMEHSHGTTTNGGIETRTVNYSYKVWKRVS